MRFQLLCIAWILRLWFPLSDVIFLWPWETDLSNERPELVLSGGCEGLEKLRNATGMILEGTGVSAGVNLWLISEFHQVVTLQLTKLESLVEEVQGVTTERMLHPRGPVVFTAEQIPLLT